jgi:predicted RNase H-like HicB family nuclease
MRGKIMKETYTALIKQTDNWWIGWIEEIPGVNCQEATQEELIESLRLTLQEALEFNRLDARELAGDSYDEELIAL